MFVQQILGLCLELVVWRLQGNFASQLQHQGRNSLQPRTTTFKDSNSPLGQCSQLANGRLAEATMFVVILHMVAGRPRSHKKLLVLILIISVIYHCFEYSLF